MAPDPRSRRFQKKEEAPEVDRERVYHLVHKQLSDDSVRALDTLLSLAKRGQIVGLAYVVMYKGREYTAGAAGECRRNPTFTRGMIRSLDDALGELVAD